MEADFSPVGSDKNALFGRRLNGALSGRRLNGALSGRQRQERVLRLAVTIARCPVDNDKSALIFRFSWGFGRNSDILHLFFGAHPEIS